MEREEKGGMTSREVQILFGILIGISFAMLFGSIFYKSLIISISLLAGLIVGLVNFYLIAKIVSILTGNEKSSKTKIIFILAAKIAVLMGVIGLIILVGHVRPLPFLVGISNTVIAAVVYGVWNFFKES